MAIAVVTSLAAGTGINGGTTSSLNTTGSTLLVVGVISYALGTVPVVVSDSKSNTWTPLTASQIASDARAQIFYAENPSSVGSGHTFSVGYVSIYAAVFVLALSGTVTTSVFDQQAGTTATSVTSFQPGSVTPGSDNEIIVSLWGVNGTYSGLSVDSGFTSIGSVAFSSGNYYGGAMGYKIQGAAAAVNPQWSWTTSRGVAGRNATFKAASGGATGGGVLIPKGPLVAGALIQSGRLVLA